MRLKLNNEKGFTLIEIVVILAVIAIIAASMVPRISGIIDDAKITRATSEVENIGMAILRFNANTGKWPARNSTGSDNALVTLVSGDSDLNVPLPAYSSDHSDTNFEILPTAATGDYLDCHLKLNKPQYTEAQAYSTSGVNRWKGPYTQQLGADPWGNAYVVNISCAYSTDTTTDLYCYVICAGPDGTIQSDGQVTSDEISTHQLSGDDVAFLLRARR